MKAVFFILVGFGAGIWVGGGNFAHTMRVQTGSVVAHINKALQ